MGSPYIPLPRSEEAVNTEQKICESTLATADDRQRTRLFATEVTVVGSTGVSSSATDTGGLG